MLIDTALTHLDHQTEVRARLSEREVVTITRVAAKCFVNN
jgi:hypothetical protein